MPDLLLAHAHLLEDEEARLVLIALGHLLVVDDEHHGHDEDAAQKEGDEEEPAVDGVEIYPVYLLMVGPEAKATHVLGFIVGADALIKCVQQRLRPVCAQFPGIKGDVGGIGPGQRGVQVLPDVFDGGRKGVQVIIPDDEGIVGVA